MDAQLYEAYANTTFIAYLPDQQLRIRVGQSSTELDALLNEQHESSWTFITAHNPRSVRLSDEANTARHAELESLLRDRGLRFYQGVGIGDGGEWPPEDSVLVVGVDEDEAREIGRRFEQNTIVYGTMSRKAVLLTCV